MINYVFVSGGPDSMYMAHLLKENVGKGNGKYVIVHIIDHSLPEQEIVEAKKAVLSIIDHFDGIFYFDEPEGNLGSHHNFIKDVMSKIHNENCCFYFAHNASDVVEQFFVDICNVRNPFAFGSESFHTPDGYNIQRPIINKTKDFIIEECERLNIPHVNSSFNLEVDNLRGYIRNVFLPGIENVGADNSYLIPMQRSISMLRESFNILSKAVASKAAFNYVEPREGATTSFVVQTICDDERVFIEVVSRKFLSEFSAKYPTIKLWDYRKFLAEIVLNNRPVIVALDSSGKSIILDNLHFVKDDISSATFSIVIAEAIMEA